MGALLRWMEGGDSGQWGSGDRGGPSGAWCRPLGGRAVGAVLGVAASPTWEDFSPLLCVLTTVNLCPCSLDLSGSIGTQLNTEVTQRDLCGGASGQRRGGAGGAEGASHRQEESRVNFWLQSFGLGHWRPAAAPPNFLPSSPPSFPPSTFLPASSLPFFLPSLLPSSHPSTHLFILLPSILPLTHPSI